MVLPTVRHCACLAQVTTVGSGAHVPAVKQLNENDLINAGRNINGSQPVFRALDARASSADSHALQTILKITVSRCVACPRIQIAPGITVVSCSTNWQQFKRTPRTFERDKVSSPPLALQQGKVLRSKTTQVSKGRRNATLHNKEVSAELGEQFFKLRSTLPPSGHVSSLEGTILTTSTILANSEALAHQQNMRQTGR